MREFFCPNCGLLFHEAFGDGGYSYVCPSCKNTMLYTTDSTMWAISGAEILNASPKAWSSDLYTPPDVVEQYRNQGIEIKAKEATS